ncbi:MAG: transposase [Actinomycetia bacterium]|nr:transposase [Actinomycetes bacterium]
MTRALGPEVVEAIWAAIEPILPPPDTSHPLGCHNPRVPDKVCFRGILIRLVTGSSWVDIEAIMNFEVSDTTLRRRRDQWIDAGVFEQLEAEARAGYDHILELDLDVVAIDGSLHKAPCGGEGTGPNPTDRAKLGWKWSAGSDRAGIPVGWAIDAANRNDIRLLDPTNTWWTNHGQLRRNTDCRTRHRHAALQLATTVLIVGRLLDYRNRWSPKPTPTG